MKEKSYKENTLYIEKMNEKWLKKKEKKPNTQNHSWKKAFSEKCIEMNKGKGSLKKPSEYILKSYI